MAIQTLDTRKPLSAGQQITKGLVSGLGDYLNRAAESKLKEIEAQRVAQGLQGLGFAPEEAQGLSKLNPELQKTILAGKASARQAEVRESQTASKESQKYFNSVLAANEAADFADKRLGKMEALINKGNLPVSTFYNLFKNLEESVPPAFGAAAGATGGTLAGGIPGGLIGGAIGGLISPVGTLLRSAQKFTSPDTEQFEKLSNDFVREAKSIFGNRITDADLKVFMSLVPTLSQTDKGKRDIIKNLKSFNEAAKLKANVAKQIIKENKGRVPQNLQLEVEERAKPYLDLLSKEFTLA